MVKPEYPDLVSVHKEEEDPATLSDLFFPVPQSYMHTVSLPTFTGWFVEALTINVLVSTKVL